MRRYRYTSPLDLPSISAAELLDGSGDGVFLDAGRERRVFTRLAPRFVDDPDGTGLFGLLEAERVEYPPSFTVGVTDATVTGYRTTLWSGRFFQDDAPRGEELERHIIGFSSQNSFLNEETGLQAIPGIEDFTLSEGGRPRVRLPGRTVMLTSHEPTNYGSWLFRVLPKLHALRLLRLTGDQILVSIYNHTMRQSLACCGITAAQIVNHDIHTIFGADRLIVPCLRNTHAFLDPQSHALFGTLRSRFGQPRSGRRVYVSRVAQARKGSNGRVMQNETALIAALLDQGFDIIEPETLSFEQQIAVFSSAGLVVGPSGSGMFNAAFCHPGTQLIDIESEPHWIHAHLCLFSSCQLAFGIFVGSVDGSDPNRVHRRWSVNIPALLDRIADVAR